MRLNRDEPAGFSETCHGDGVQLFFDVERLGVKRNKKRVRGRKLLLAAIRDNQRVALESNPELAVGIKTDWPDLPGEKLILGVSDKNLPGIQRGERVHLPLLLCPPTIDPNKYETLNEFFDAGCFLIENPGVAAKQQPSSPLQPPK